MLPALLASLVVTGCKQRSNPTGLTTGGSALNSVHDIPATPSCNTPQEGCACATDAKVVDCGSVVRQSGSYTACSVGQRICSDRKWGACEGDKIAMLPDGAPGVRTQGLGSSKACVDN